MLHFSTSPYFSKRREISLSERRGWMPVTKRFEPGLTDSSSSSSSPRRFGGGPLRVGQLYVKVEVSMCRKRTGRVRSLARRGSWYHHHGPDQANASGRAVLGSRGRL